MLKFRSALFGLFVLLIFAAGTLFLILTQVNPYDTEQNKIILFFASLFLVLLTLLTFMLYFLTSRMTDREPIKNLGLAFRYSLWVSLIVCGLLALESLRVLTWWDGGLLILAVVMLELFLRSK
jgi:hypothetical protein